MTEIQIETPNNNCLRQSMDCAFSMAGYAGIELSQPQAKNYAEIRITKKSSTMSDQKLLYFFLEPSQQEAFRNRYAHMDFDAIPEQIDTNLIHSPLVHKVGEQALMLAQVS